KEYHEWIADYYTCRPANFVVMDALQGLQNGPAPCYDQAGVSDIKQAQKNLRCILASKDGLAIDTTEANIENWNIDTIVYLGYLTQAGKVGNGNDKNITVLGKKVDDIRSDFAGVLPPYGGKPLTAAQKAVPTLSIDSASFDGQNLNLKLTASADTDKLDIYINGEYAGSIADNLQNVTLDASKFSNGTLNITVDAYNHFMFHAEATTTANK
ncbi:MAG: hypothetical protein FWD71_02910, partial [Oscillospiraceae bacterium]|nr:hypothetical protein [Oscillospiraceae bacterium]